MNAKSSKTSTETSEYLMQQLRRKVVRVFDLKGLDCTKVVRNFLCDHITNLDMVISYAPSQEFSSKAKTLSVAGGWLCSPDTSSEKYATKEKVNFRIIRCLYEAGFLRVRDDLHPPHPRCVMLSWSPEAANYQREILRAHILNETYGVTARVVNTLAAYHGLKVVHIKSKGLFEIVKPNGAAIPKGKTPRTWILSNAAGEPVNRFKDMNELEWEDVIYRTAKRAGTVGKPAKLPDNQSSYFSVCKRAN